MKILMLTNVVAPDKLGGLERYVRELSGELVLQGHSVTVVAKRTKTDQPDVEVGHDGVRVLRHSAPRKSNPLFAFLYPFWISRAVGRGVKAARDEWADTQDLVIHAHFPLPAFYLAARSIPYVYTCHAPVYKEILGERQGTYALPPMLGSAAVAGLRLMERFVLRRASNVVTLSKFVRGEVHDLDAEVGTRVSLVPGGLDTLRFSPSSEGADTGKGVDGAPILFTARRLVQRTGVEALVAGFPSILHAYPNAKLYIAGDGHRRSHIEAAIASLGLENSVTLLGRISEAELVDWYRVADISITPTQELEGFGLSTVEALACGTPGLVTPIGANSEVVRALSSQLISRDESPAEIAAAVISLWADKAELRRVREQARGFVHPRLGWPAVARRYVQIYESMQIAQNS